MWHRRLLCRDMRSRYQADSTQPGMTGAYHALGCAVWAVDWPASAALGAATLLEVRGTRAERLTCVRNRQGPRRLGRAWAKSAWRARGSAAHSMQNTLDAIGMTLLKSIMCSFTISS